MLLADVWIVLRLRGLQHHRLLHHGLLHHRLLHHHWLLHHWLLHVHWLHHRLLHIHLLLHVHVWLHIHWLLHIHRLLHGHHWLIPLDSHCKTLSHLTHVRSDCGCLMSYFRFPFSPKVNLAALLAFVENGPPVIKASINAKRGNLNSS